MTDTPPKGFRTFLIVWGTQSLAVSGGGMTGFALNIYLVQVLYPAPGQKAELALALTVLNLGFVIPFVFVGPIAGAFADRHERKRIMIAADMTNAALTLVIFALMLGGALKLPLLVAIGIMSALASTFHYAAYDSSVAMLVPDRLLPRANGMVQTVWSLSGIVSPGLAAVIMALPALAAAGGLPFAWLVDLRDGTPLVFALEAVILLFAACVLGLLEVPSPRRADAGESGEVKTGILADVRAGALYVVRRPPLLWLLGTFTVANLAGAPFGVVTPLLVKFNLAADWAARGFSLETALALLVTAGGLGGLLGGISVSLWGGLKRKRVLGVLVPMLGAGLFEIVYGLSPFILLTAAAAFAGAAMHPVLNAHSQAIWQTQTPRDMQGRVFAVRRVIAQGSLPLGTALAGGLAGSIDPGLVLAGLGLLLALVCFIQLFNPVLMRVEDKALRDQQVAGR
jgi:MFS transporter, DHA3 family, macrolide efflux protein